MAFTDQKRWTLLGYAVVPDIAGTVEMMEKIAGGINPDKFKPGAVRSEAGKMLNDPGLDNVDRSIPLMVTVYYNPEGSGMAAGGMANLSFAVFIPAKDRAAYKKKFDGLAMPCVIERDVLVVSNKKSSLDGALKDIDLYKKTAAQKLHSDARFVLKIGSAISLFDAEIRMFMSLMQRPESQNAGQSKQAESVIALGKLFLYGMLDLTMQTKDYQLDITLNEKALLFSSEHSARPGSDLYNFFNGTAPGRNSCLKLFTEKGDFTYAGYLDMKRLNHLIGVIVTGALKRDPSLEGKINMPLINEYRSIMGYYPGEFAIAYGFDENSRLKMGIAATTNRSAKSHLAMNERFIVMYRDALKKLSAGQDVFTEYALKKNVRKSGGFDVHRYILKMNYAAMREEEKAAMYKMFGQELTTEYTVANGFVIASTSPETLDKMVINSGTAGGGVELLSMKTFGTGMDSYYDFDIAGFIKKIAKLAGTAGGQQDTEIDRTIKMLDKIPAEDRVLVSSSKYSEGTSYNRYQVSVKMLSDLMKFFNEQKAASMKKDQPVYENKGDGYK
jgi:hypothetical protein